jgi:hypothetical protein
MYRASSCNYKPRLVIEITDSQSQFLGQFVPHGMRKAAFAPLLDLVIEGIKQHGVGALAALTDGKVKIDWGI